MAEKNVMLLRWMVEKGLPPPLEIFCKSFPRGGGKGLMDRLDGTDTVSLMMWEIALKFLIRAPIHITKL